jgi:glycosyltransferase involved in cell wall biosynthesis
LVSPGQPTELADALLRALTSPEADDWGEEGARLVAREFGLDRMVRDYEEVYRELMDV